MTRLMRQLKKCRPTAIGQKSLGHGPKWAWTLPMGVRDMGDRDIGNWDISNWDIGVRGMHGCPGHG